MSLEKTIQKCSQMVGHLMRDYEEELQQAIRELEPPEGEKGNPKLSVSINFVIEDRPESQTYGLTGTMSFTARKIKDQVKATVSEGQDDLPFDND